MKGAWTKHHRPLEVPTKIHIPYSVDGITIDKASYRVVAMVLHQGASHENGHFVAIHACDNTYWHVDDNQYPQPILGLSSQQEQEILQVWLIHDPSDEMEYVILEEIIQPVNKKAKTHYDVVPLRFANVTTFGRKIQDWVWSKADNIIMLQDGWQ